MINLCKQSDCMSITEIINDAATAYKDVIPEDRYHEPYMSIIEVESEINSGVVFWGYWDVNKQLIGIMGLQDKGDVSLIRHAYVKTSHRSKGIGSTLIDHLLSQTEKPILIGTWATASWAIRFYERFGFKQVSVEVKELLLRKYWDIPVRQIEESIVLSNDVADKNHKTKALNIIPSIERANITDAESILTLQKMTYKSEAKIYNDFNIEPLTQTIEGVWNQFEDHLFLKAVIGSEIVGSVRAKLLEGTCYIGKLIVHPNYQNRGIGKQLMAEIEASFAACLRYELFTGNKSEKNLQLYVKNGYSIFKTIPIDEQLSLVYLEKLSQKVH